MAPVSDLLQRALAIHQGGDPSAARPLYEEVLALDPDNEDARHLLGVVARAEGRYVEALTLLGEVLQRNPGFPAAQINMQTTLAQAGEQSLVLAAEGRWEEALAICNGALAHNPDLLPYLHTAARASFYLGRVGMACHLVGKALGIAPSALRNRDALVGIMEEFARSLTHPPEVAAKTPEEPAANHERDRTNIATLLLQFMEFCRVRGDWGRLERTARARLLLVPDDGESHYNLALVHDACSQYDAAWRALDAIPPDHPRAADGLVLAAGGRFAAEDFTGAEGLFLSALAIDHTRTDAVQGVLNCARHRHWMRQFPEDRKIRLSGRVRIFIVTYNDTASLTRNIAALQECLEDPDIYVINNHKDPVDRFVPEGVTVYNNVLRHPNSTGHLARSWNQALLFGFGRANAPECDWVIGLQDDLVVRKSLWRLFEAERTTFDFMMIGPGDQFWAINIEGLKKIGFWDECLTSIVFQEADYYHRAHLALGERACLEDHGHQPPGATLIRTTDLGLRRLLHGVVSDDNAARLLRKPAGDTYPRQWNYFTKKWGADLDCHNFLISKNRTEPAPETFCFYPWFFD